MIITFLEHKSLQEKLITFGKKAYPKFGNVVILAGGAGSGKGFQLEKLLGIEGKVFDVDHLKQLAIKSEMFAKRIKDETGQDIKNYDLKNPDNVSKLHDVLSSVYNLPKKNERTMFADILAKPDDRKPNLIFDVTMKDLAKLESISRNVSELGYDKRNIHLVWIVNDFKVAMDQNKKRSRVVSDEILMSTHEGAAITMKKILDSGEQIKKYLDGDIYITFNKVGVDTSIEKSDKGGSYVKDANYVKVKEQGKSIKSTAELDKEVYNKIKDYVPEVQTW